MHKVTTTLKERNSALDIPHLPNKYQSPLKRQRGDSGQKSRGAEKKSCWNYREAIICAPTVGVNSFFRRAIWYNLASQRHPDRTSVTELDMIGPNCNR